MAGKMDNSLDHTHESANRVYCVDGLCPTINTMGGGNLQPKIIEDFFANREPRVYEGVAPTIRAEREGLKVMEETKCVGGIGEKKSNGGTQYFQQDRVYNGDIALAMPSQLPGGSYKYLQGFRIRKLTPRECWRLMGYTDDDFDKAAAVNSNTQLYKQAGNAIVKQVLMAIFSQMNIKGVKPWNEVHR